MGRDEPRHECNEPSQDLRETLTAFWGNQLNGFRNALSSRWARRAKVRHLLTGFGSSLDVATETESTWTSSIPHLQSLESDL